MNWHKLSEEKPEKEGWYLTYDPAWEDFIDRFDMVFWSNNEGWVDYNTLHDDVTHWAKLSPPEET